MYCERCGSLLDGTEQRCNVCGNQVQGSGIRLNISDAEEVVFNPPYSGDEEIVWNVHDFSTPRKTDTIDFRWREEEAGNAQEAFHPEASEQEEVLEEEAFFQNEESLEEEIFKDILGDQAEKEDSENIDKFFTFSKKNEEFQQLLDREYEKIRKRADLNFTAMSKLSSESQAVEAEPLVQAVPEKEILEELPLQSDETSAPGDEVPLPSNEIKEEKKHSVRHTQAHNMEAARKAFFQGESSHENNEDGRNDEETEGDQHIRDIHDLQEGQDVQSLIDGLKSLEESDAEGFPEPIGTAPATTVDLFFEEVAQQQQRPGFLQEESDDEAQAKATDKKKKGCLGKAVLMFLLVVLLVEATMLGIKILFPESAASAYLTKTQGPMVNAAARWIGQIKDNFGGSVPANTGHENEDKEGTDQEDGEKEEGADQVQPDPAPMVDKEKLIATQMSLNKNIAKIAPNAALCYQSQKDYSVKDVNQSKEIEYNIWKTTEEGKTLYYDQAVVGAIIGFNSSWIDYVNMQDKQVLNYVQKGSKAYENTITFSKAGKITETFDLLEFGEIRQGEKGFYVWVHEEISITEKGVKTSKQHNWIYYLEPSGNQMEIVNYFKFQ